ncbi:putative clathrin assembly protein At4g02650 [Impatiens glandulifera]|uniref:putative clathrin assembly protein At4g02650 n=1 Tax=Impatiens glandulifera TaxID=253017 RepID=UPI001FB0E85E|nr:putative clathrin assembly protein At4g02650 [Impatiens glandulifera]
MAPSSKLRKAIGAVKDQTSISLAKVGTSASLSDLEVAIVKATRHEEYPAEEKYIREILSLTFYSRASIGACVDTISRRLRKTKNWIVALKTLTLIHRLLGDGDPAFEHEIFFATRRGTRLLNLSDFRDCSRPDAWDYSAFVRSYAFYLDDQLEFKMQGRKSKSKRKAASSFSYEEDEDGGEERIASPKEEEAMKSSKIPYEEMKTETLFSRIQNLMRLLERFLACYPTGSAAHNRVVLIALNPVVKESFRIYYDITEIQRIMIDRFTTMEFSHLVIVYEIFCRLRELFDELDQFHDWCKRSGVARSLDFVDIQKITQKKLNVMDDYVRGKSSQRQNQNQIDYYKVEEEDDDDEKEEVKQIHDEEIKALPAPEPEPPEPEQSPIPAKIEKTQTEGDLLNLGEDAMSIQENGDMLALALFNGGIGGTQSTTTTMSPWEAFNDNTENWESSLVQSASYLGNQTTTFSGGFDMLMLDGMYQQGSNAAAKMNYVTTGSASSVALGSVGRPAMLALPAPPSADVGKWNVDPFAASLVVPPPSYVQMSEMEKKRKLLVEEQMMWQQYSTNGVQGQIRYSNNNMQQNPFMYNRMGG